MSKTTFEKLGIPYEERDGIFYPVLVAGTEKADIEAGKYGRMWIKYIKEEYPMRYKSLVRFGELEERADEVNDTAYELLDDIEAKWLKKHTDRWLVKITAIFYIHLNNKIIPHLLKCNIFLYNLQLHPQRCLAAFFAQIIGKKLL